MNLKLQQPQLNTTAIINTKSSILGTIPVSSDPFTGPEGIVRLLTLRWTFENLIPTEIVCEIHKTYVRPRPFESNATYGNAAKTVCHETKYMLNTASDFEFLAVTLSLPFCEWMVPCALFTNLVYTAHWEAFRDGRTGVCAVCIEHIVIVHT